MGYIDKGAPSAPSEAGGIIFPLILLGIYIYVSYMLYKIAEKTGTPNSWFAFIPLLNIILIIQMAGKSLWWILAMFVPIVNVIVIVWLWMQIAEKVHRPAWWGILMVIGPVNLILLWFMAFRDGNASISQTQPMNTPTPPSAPSIPA